MVINLSFEVADGGLGTLKYPAFCDVRGWEGLGLSCQSFSGIYLKLPRVSPKRWFMYKVF